MPLCAPWASPSWSRSTTGTPTRWATASATRARTGGGGRRCTSSTTVWSGSTPSRTWRSGPSTGCRSKPSTPSVRGPGATWCWGARGSQVPPSPRGTGCPPWPALMLTPTPVPNPCPLPVPSSGPSNVSALATTSSSMLVRWSDIPEADCNGLILGYKVSGSGSPGSACPRSHSLPGLCHLREPVPVRATLLQPGSTGGCVLVASRRFFCR